MTRRVRKPDPEKLKQDLLLALSRARERERSQLVPMVEALLATVPAGSPDWVFAQRTLAELLVSESPWRAAVAARAATTHAPDDAAAHGLLGLSLTLLGHYQAAARAYREALALDPGNPWYAHNLGHLLDVALGRPYEAVPWLRRAHDETPHVEVTASLAHALGRTGRAREAETLLADALGDAPGDADHAALLEWLRKGAPERTGPRGDARA